MPTCFWREHFNIICPFCGGTRCVINTLTLNFADGFKYHPVLFIYMFFLAGLVITYFCEKTVSNSHIVTLDLFVNSFYVFIGAVIAQYFLRILLLINGIEIPFIYTYIWYYDDKKLAIKFIS